MSVQPSVAIVKSASLQTLSRPVESTFEERWAAWQARGDEHDRAVRRRVRIAIPALMVITAVVYLLFAR
jgi:hypothetical protein